MVPIVEVRGGSHGVAVSHEEARALAATYDRAGDRMREWAVTGGRVLLDGDLLASALLSPVTFAAAEAAVLAATTGPDGVLGASLGWEADALLVRAIVASFERTDQAVGLTFDAIDRQVGQALGFAGGRAAATWLVGGALSYAAYVALPASEQAAVRAAAGRGSTGIQEWMTHHPALVEHAVSGGGGLVDGLWSGLTGQSVLGPDGRPLLHPSTSSAAELLSGVYPDDGAAQVVARDDLDPHGQGSSTVPRDLAAMLTHLREVSLLSQGSDSPDNGTVEVQTITGSNGTRHVVYLPGTDDMATSPWSRDDDVRDLPTNFAAIGGASTSYAEGILEAMERAGVRPGEPVALVGHSQGGIMAAWLAAHQDTYDVTAVVTAGSPVAGLGPFPDGVRLLSLENAEDIVPLLDGAPNPDTPHHVTAVFDDPAGGPDPVVDAHELGRYVKGAAALDASTDPSVADALARLRDDGFLASDDPARTQILQVSRR
jgi:hypothetical protein